MRVVIQRVLSAKVEVEGHQVGEIEKGLLVLLGIGVEDDDEDLEWLLNKTLNLRIFNDEKGIMNKSLLEIEGALMVVSQFTLLAATKKGNRPSYIRAAKHEHAIPLYEAFCQQAELKLKQKVARGVFGAQMQISLVNDGPVTLHIDSKKRE